MNKILLLIFTLIFFPIYAQSLLIGEVLDKDKQPLSQVLVVNITTRKNTHSNPHGVFAIEAKAGDVLRFIAPNFQRADHVVRSGDFNKHLSLTLSINYYKIAEVEVGFQPTGDLASDLLRLPKPLEELAVNRKVQKSIGIGRPKKAPLQKNVPKDFDKFNAFAGGGVTFSIGGTPPIPEQIGIKQYSATLYRVFGEPFFLALKIPKQHIMDFIDFTLVHESKNRPLVFILDQRNWAEIRRLLEDNAESFLATL